MKSVETDLLESQEIFRLLVDAVNDYAIFALDLYGNILTWNSGARRLKGYEKEEVIGTHFSRFYTPPDIERSHPQHELELAIENGRYEEEGWRVKKDGSRFWASVLITPLRDQGGKLRGFAKVTRDLTERKLAEDQLRAAYDSLEHRVEERTAELTQAKNEAEVAVRARDQFLSIASHELKTPLTSLKLQAQLRKRSMDRGNHAILEPARFRKLVEDDEKQLNRITRLVDDMLDISRLTTGKFPLHFEPVDLAELAREVVERLQPQFEAAGVEVRVAPSSVAPGHWDRFRIEQVMTNLLTNAVRYGAGRPVTVEAGTQGQAAYFLVRDQGIGIAPADQARIFQQFERAVTHREVSGLGLGLFIAREIVVAHGGKITVKSALGQGAEFRFDLPSTGL